MRPCCTVCITACTTVVACLGALVAIAAVHDATPAALRTAHEPTFIESLQYATFGIRPTTPREHLLYDKCQLEATQNVTQILSRIDATIANISAMTFGLSVNVTGLAANFTEHVRSYELKQRVDVVWDRAGVTVIVLCWYLHRLWTRAPAYAHLLVIAVVIKTWLPLVPFALESTLPTLIYPVVSAVFHAVPEPIWTLVLSVLACYVSVSKGTKNLSRLIATAANKGVCHPNTLQAAVAFASNTGTIPATPGASTGPVVHLGNNDRVNMPPAPGGVSSKSPQRASSVSFASTGSVVIISDPDVSDPDFDFDGDDDVMAPSDSVATEEERALALQTLNGDSA